MLFFRSCFSLSFFAALFGVFSLPSVFAFSAESYQIGPLLDGEAAPFTIDQTFRVSLWDTYDVRAGDIREDGTINPSARHYGGYQTSVSLSPDESGIYTLVLASLVGFPDPIGSLQMFMQVEYKEFGSPDTSYLSYDFVNDPPWQNITRQLLLDEASYFTGDAGPLTNYNTFILDGNGNAPDAVILQFGEVLGETLRWSIANSRFELSDNLKIGNGTASDVMLIFDDGSSRNFGWDDSESLFSTFNEPFRFRTQQGSAPSMSCSSTVAGMQWMDIDNGTLYLCDVSNGRNKWLSSQDVVIFGENSGSCSAGTHLGNDEGCQVQWGSSLGSESATNLGFYLIQPITITGYGFSTNDDSCVSGYFDLELWSTGSNTDDNTYTAEANIATLLTDETHNSNKLNINIAGNQYLMWGIDNHCEEDIDNWNMTLYYRWRAD